MKHSFDCAKRQSVVRLAVLAGACSGDPDAGSGDQHLRVLVQRRAIPSLEEWQQLEGVGLKPEAYLGELTWVLELPTAVASGAAPARVIADFGASAGPAEPLAPWTVAVGK